jgi:hypothetical protein
MAAKARLTPADVLRKSEPDYKLGWNAQRRQPMTLRKNPDLSGPKALRRARRLIKIRNVNYSRGSCMASVRVHRLRRAIASGSRVLLILAPAVLTATVTTTLTGKFDASAISIPWWIIIGGILGVVLLGYQAYAEYKLRTYDPTWAYKFDERFYGDEIKNARAKAATILKSNQGKLRRTNPELDDIDNILDFFEDVGFYVHGDQITPEVAHHHFYHWIRGYYLASRDYIEAWQTTEPRWEYVAKLFKTTHQIENERLKGKAPKSLKDREILTFLNQEIELIPADTSGKIPI